MTENGFKRSPLCFEFHSKLHWVYLVIISVVVHLCFSTPYLHAQTPQNEKIPIVSIETGKGFGPINASISAYTETNKIFTLEDVRSAAIAKQFKPIETRVADFGYLENGIWLKFPVQNLTQESAEQLLLMHTNFMRTIDVYFVERSNVIHALHQDENSVFSTRPIPYHQLVAPLDIPAMSEGNIFIRYTSEGSTNMSISLETPLSFAQTTNFRVTIDFVFYGIMTVFIVASLLGRLFWRNPTFLAYALYAASVLLYMFQRDGYAFQYLWPNSPQWNNFSSLPLGSSLIIFAAFFTRAYLNSNKLHPIIDKILIGLVIMQILVVASAFVIGGSSAKQLAIMSTMIGIIIYFCIGLAAYKKYGRRTLFFVIGWLGILIASISMTLIHWARVEILGAESIDLMRIAMVFDSLMLGLASVVSIVEIQKDREKLITEQMNTLSTNLDLHTRLGRLEQKYNFMQNFAERASQRVVDTKHDLQQPLFALRSALSEFTSAGKSAKSRDEIEESLTYIEGLVETVFEESLEQGEVPLPREEDGAERVQVGKLFSSLKIMFKNDANKNGIDFKTIHSGQYIYAAPFPVLRILANFISNAIRYAPNARITIGAKRCGDYIFLEVHDTGPGMAPEELAIIKGRHQRGEAADNKNADKGLGLGLSIVEKLVQENKLDWTITSEKNRGTTAKLRVPFAD